MTLTQMPVPNSQGGEYCPDFPSPCVCPIEPQHRHMPVHRSPCGHCGHEVEVPNSKPEGTVLSKHDVVMAGGGYCPRCRGNLCAACSDKDPHQVNYDCASRR